MKKTKHKKTNDENAEKNKYIFLWEFKSVQPLWKSIWSFLRN